MAIKIRRYPPLSQECTLANSCQINENNATVLNEHGYFGSPIRHYCRLCEALNYNNRCRFKYDEVIPYLEYIQGREIIQRLISIVVEGLKLSQRFLKKRKTTAKSDTV